MGAEKEKLKNFKATCNKCGEPAEVEIDQSGGELGGDLEVAVVCTNPKCTNREPVLTQSW